MKRNETMGALHSESIPPRPPAKTNPAKRLLAILKEAREYQPEKERTFNVWQSVLGKHSVFTTLRRLVWLDRQFDETARDIRRIHPTNQEHYLKDFDDLRKAISPENFNQIWASTKGHISVLQLERLQFSSLTLDEHSTELEIKDETLRAIKEEVDNLLNEVLESELPPSLKDLIVRLLQMIQSAIVDYRLGGIAALEEKLQSVFGVLVFRKPEVDQHVDEPLVRRFGQILWKVLQVVQTARSIAELPEAVKKFLPPGVG